MLPELAIIDNKSMFSKGISSRETKNYGKEYACELQNCKKKNSKILYASK